MLPCMLVDYRVVRLDYQINSVGRSLV
uniref:Uncharacterized protein n=1 Tax=Rhizophora mucronata TaxID=61149 RepID=A0A2P2P245_RHIMU